MTAVQREPEITGIDGTVRKAHYGAGRQPWDDIKDAGWAPEFAAGNALKYVRRHAAKNGADDLEKGRWYYRELVRMSAAGRQTIVSTRILAHLRRMLTADELTILEAGL